MKVTTHNTEECHHHKMDGTPIRGTIGQAGRKSGKDRNSKQYYMQVLAHVEKLEKSLKPTKRTGNIAVTRKVTVMPTLHEALGLVVSGKNLVIVRNQKLILN